MALSKLCTDNKMKGNELTVKDSNILAPAQSIEENQYVKYGFYKASQSVRHVCYNESMKQWKMFSQSYVPGIFCDSEGKRRKTAIKHL